MDELVLRAYIMITVKSGSEREFLKQISKFKEVIEANLVIGENDVVLKINTSDISHIDQFLTENVQISVESRNRRRNLRSRLEAQCFIAFLNAQPHVSKRSAGPLASVETHPSESPLPSGAL